MIRGWTSGPASAGTPMESQRAPDNTGARCHHLQRRRLHELLGHAGMLPKSGGVLFGSLADANRSRSCDHERASRHEPVEHGRDHDSSHSSEGKLPAVDFPASGTPAKCHSMKSNQWKWAGMPTWATGSASFPGSTRQPDNNSLHPWMTEHENGWLPCSVPLGDSTELRTSRPVLP